ncbi:MAG: GNAT family N-acetyltransferase [Caldilineaceae bacterium]|nr:GNAT family N-acetyltransferase [Caldilineaceae bacterium]
MSSDLYLRPATLEDAAAIAAVHVQSWQETYTGLMPEAVIARQSIENRLRMWQQILDKGESFVYVAEDEREGIVGFVSAGAARELTDKFDGEIYALYLLRSHQGRGMGRALMQTVAARLHEVGYRSLVLWVLASNETCRFYAHMGGVPVAEKQDVVGEAVLVEIAFGWPEITAMGTWDREKNRPFA